MMGSRVLSAFSTGDRRSRLLAGISAASGVLLVAWVVVVLVDSPPWLLVGLAGTTLVLIGTWHLAGRPDPRPAIGLGLASMGGLVIAVAVAQTSLTAAVLVSRMSVVLGLAVAAAGFARAAAEARAEPPTDPRPDAPGSVR